MNKKGLIGAIKYTALIGAVLAIVILFAFDVMPVFATDSMNSTLGYDSGIFFNTTTLVNSTGGQYAPLKNYGFQVNVTNSSAIVGPGQGPGNCTFYTNITGIFTNYTWTTTPAVTMSSNYSVVADNGWNMNVSTFTINFTQEQTAGAGLFYYTWACQDTNGKWNFTDNRTYTANLWTNPGIIVQNSSWIYNMYINGTAATPNSNDARNGTVGETYTVTANVSDLHLANQSDLYLTLYQNIYNLTSPSGTGNSLLGAPIVGNTTNQTITTLTSTTTAYRINLTVWSNGNQNYSANTTGITANITFYGYYYPSCTFTSQPRENLRTTVNSPMAVTCYAYDNKTGVLIPRANISFYNGTTTPNYLASNYTDGLISTAATTTTIAGAYFSSVGVFRFNATVDDNATTITPYYFYNHTSLLPNNVSQLMYVTSLINPRPLIINDSSITTNFTYNNFLIGLAPDSTNNTIGNWSQMRTNYSIEGIMFYPNYTNGTFNGMVMPTDRYANAKFQDRNFWEYPTTQEFLAYNLTFDVQLPSATIGAKLNVTVPLPFGGFTSNPLYRNQTMLPASWQTMTPPISEKLDGTDMTPMLVLSKNPNNFSVTIYKINRTNVTGTISLTGCGMFLNTSSATCPNVSYSDGKLQFNLSGAADTNYSIELMMGLQDDSCIQQMGQSFDQTLFNQYCMQNYGPPRLEASPIYILEQSVSGANPFTSTAETAPTLNVSNTTTFIINVTDTLLNYTANNLLITYQVPINMTSLNDSTTMTVSSGHAMGYYNNSTGGAALWQSINMTQYANGTFIYVNTTEGCTNMTDSMPGSPTSGKYIQMCFKSFMVNLSQPNIAGTDGWEYGDIAKLNISMTTSFSMLNQSTTVRGGGSAAGAAGNTTQYNFTVGGQQGTFKINTTTLPYITGDAGTSACRVGQNSSGCTNITVYVNGQIYYNWTTGSIVINSQQSGIQSVSVSYTVPATATTTVAATGVTTTVGGTSSSVSEQSVAITEIAAGDTKTMTFTETDLGVTSVAITAENALSNIALKISTLTEIPSVVTVIDEIAYKYLSFNPTRLEDSDIREAKITFKVTKSWITENNIDIPTIKISRWADSKWNALSTAKLSETDADITYQATTPGFSYFVISGKALATAGESNTTATEEAVPADYTWLAYVVLIIVIAAIGYYFYTKRPAWKRSHVSMFHKANHQ